LVDEDDESTGSAGGIAGGVSYVSELQQRRLQAASFSEKSQTVGFQILVCKNFYMRNFY
jgi:hypothetical protein